MKLDNSVYLWSHDRMSVYQLDPCTDPRWLELLARHPGAGVFHTPAWLGALSRTYGYEPVVYTTTPPRQELADGIVFCCVNSWLTGRRLVSLPFSDHCEPLADGSALVEILDWLAQQNRRKRWKYIEFRPVIAPQKVAGFEPNESFFLNRIDLSSNWEAIQQRFHKDCIQRAVRKAHRSAVIFEEGNNDGLFERFFHLMTLTRRRHRLVPQPRAWFRNLMAAFGPELKFRLASLEGRPVSCILTLHSKDVMTYKYGASDPEYHKFGCVPAVMARAIEDAKQLGDTSYDMGRSDRDNEGLLRFKDQWGSIRTELHYLRNPATGERNVPDSTVGHLARAIFARLPDPLLVLAGALLYRHKG
jgi:hypothetical protein